MISSLVFSAALGCSSVADEDKIENWIARNVDNTEKVECKRTAGGEYFFLARAGEEVKVGSRIDVTQYKQAYVLLVSWVFLNEKQEPLVQKVLPRRIRDEHVHVGDKAFSENVQYQHLALAGSKTMKVTVEIKKCSSSQCDRQQSNARDEKQYAIELCEVSLGQAR